MCDYAPAPMLVTRTVLIQRPIDDVYAFLADPHNDPSWCPKVLSVEQLHLDRPGPGARYKVMHRPVPFLSAREMDYACLDATPPSSIRWHEQDRSDTLTVTYTLEDCDGATRFTQHSDAQLGAPRLLHPLMRLGIGHDIARQLKRLAALLKA